MKEYFKNVQQNQVRFKFLHQNTNVLPKLRSQIQKQTNLINSNFSKDLTKSQQYSLQCLRETNYKLRVQKITLMEAFTLWSKQIHNQLTDMVVAIASSFIRFIAHRLPHKPVHLDYNTPHVDAQPADPSKTIITVDFKNLLIEYSRDEKPDFTRLHTDVSKTLMQRLMFWRRIGYYYKRRPGYDSFVRSLNRIPNTLLYLYTSQQQSVADRLLQQLRLTQLLPLRHRLYRPSCKIIDKIAKKHPAYVDTLTARVIILTASIDDQCDNSNEASRYFVEIPWSRNESTLMQYGRLLSEVITNNQQKENLHEELEDEIIHWKHRGLLQ